MLSICIPVLQLVPCKNRLHCPYSIRFFLVFLASPFSLILSLGILHVSTRISIVVGHVMLCHPSNYSSLSSLHFCSFLQFYSSSISPHSSLLPSQIKLLDLPQPPLASPSSIHRRLLPRRSPLPPPPSRTAPVTCHYVRHLPAAFIFYFGLARWFRCELWRFSLPKLYFDCTSHPRLSSCTFYYLC